LLRLCRELVDRARAKGATAAEAIAVWDRSVQTGLENNDIHSVESTEETIFGLRAFIDGSIGFIAANATSPEVLDRCTAEAVAQARVMPKDPLNGLPAPEPVKPVAGLYDEATSEAGVEATTASASELLHRIRSADDRIRVDSGSVSVSSSMTAIVSTTGIEL